MTKLEKMVNAVCHKSHEGELGWEDFEYDPEDGHYHVDPWPPYFLGEFLTFSHDPATVHPNGDDEWSIENLKELRDWLNIVLSEA